MATPKPIQPLTIIKQDRDAANYYRTFFLGFLDPPAAGHAVEEAALPESTVLPNPRPTIPSGTISLTHPMGNRTPTPSPPELYFSFKCEPGGVASIVDVDRARF